ncbi:discoidin domain-containing protein [bacterium]|nr:discoidin domain-containing protein [bacterium]
MRWTKKIFLSLMLITILSIGQELTQPFEYFAFPTTVIGTKDCHAAFEVTPEGYIFSGRAEMSFLWGEKKEPIDQRTKTLYKGWLPIVQFTVNKDGLNISFSEFADNPFAYEDAPLAFADVRFSNLSSGDKEDVFWIGIRFMGVGHRVAKEDFSPNFNYEYRNGMILRDGKLLCFVPVPDIIERGEVKKPEDYALLLGYRLKLRPAQERRLVFKMLCFPAPIERADEFNIDVDIARARVISFWTDLLKKGAWLEVPEKKVVDTYRANLIYLFIAREKSGDDYIQKVNKFQYDAFWLRDGAFMVRALDVWGFPFEAERSALYFLKYQRPDGLFLSQEGQLDGWGQTLWTFGQHFRLTKDLTFAKTVYPAVKRAMEWLIRTREETKKQGGLGKGMLPATHPHDNENVYGHIVGNDFWAYQGVIEAINFARALGYREDEERWTKEAMDYKECILDNLKEVTRRTNGYIPPSLEGGGFDWANLKSVYPCRVLEPMDPMVTATIKKVREQNFNEGLMTYAGLDNLHGYIGIDVPQTELIRGEKDKVIDAFYSLLLHTTATNGGFEMCSASSRDFGLNLTPHGCFAGKFLDLLRNMLVREEGNELHLFSCLPQAWIKPGETISFLNVPTNFGMISLRLNVLVDGGKLSLTTAWLEPPEKIVIHAPAGYRFPNGEKIEVSPDTKFLGLIWKKEKDLKVDYQEKVREYLKMRKEEEARREREWREKIERAKAKDRGNLALGKQVSASSYEPGSFPRNAVDGDDSTYWGASPYPQWLLLDLGKTEKVSRILVKTFWDDSRFYHYEVEVSQNGKNWVKVGEKKDDKPATSKGEVYTFPPIEARYVRVNMLFNSANIGVHIVELGVYR